MKRARGKPPLILVQKDGGRLSPVHPYDEERLDESPRGAVFELHPTAKRSTKQLRFYWMVLDRVVKATGQWPMAEDLHEVLMVEAGFVKRVLSPTGRWLLVRDSFALESMNVERANLYVTTAFQLLSDGFGFDVTTLVDAPGLSTGWRWKGDAA